MSDDGTQYDLVCGQGRMEAMTVLGEMNIPAIVISAPHEDQLLMSLVENIARRPPSDRDLMREVRELLRRKYTPEQNANKHGHQRSYINGVVHLLEHSEEALIMAAEAGRLPISVAVDIATGNDREIQRALSEAYETGVLRGNKLRVAKRIIAERIAKRKRSGKVIHMQRKLTGDVLVREYQRKIREQKDLVKRSHDTKDRLLLIVSAFKNLLTDEHFLTLLRAEHLSDVPEQLAERLK